VSYSQTGVPGASVP